MPFYRKINRFNRHTAGHLLAAGSLCVLPIVVFCQSVPLPSTQPVPSAQFPSTTQQFPGQNGVTNGTLIPLGQPQYSRVPPNSSGFATPGFDPYVGRVQPSTSPLLPGNSSTPVLPPLAPGQGFGNPTYANPNLPNTGFPGPNPPTSQGVPFNAMPNGVTSGGQIQGPGWIPGSPQFNPNASFPSSVYPNATPPALFPNALGSSSPYGGNWNGSPNSWRLGDWWRRFWNRSSTQPAVAPNTLGTGWFNGGPNGPIWNGQSQFSTLRFFQGPRVRHSYLSGDSDPTSLEINDTDVSLVFAIPNLLGSLQPLYIVPSFSIHSWDGPNNTPADLPGSAYSAFLDLGWQSDPLRTFGLDLGVRVGVFSDFETFNGDSLRILGKVLGTARLTPNSTLRLGAYYIDRKRYKLVPAGGILWTPNPDTRFDIFFPEPKLSHYLTTVGTNDVWWYLTGYYGGGSWTITRADSTEDSVDINDIRLSIGAEWGRNDAIRRGQRLGFGEIGYVFNREILFAARPADNIDIDDAFFVRLGFGY